MHAMYAPYNALVLVSLRVDDSDAISERMGTTSRYALVGMSVDLLKLLFVMAW